MKSTIAAVGLLAAVAQAYDPARAFQFYPRSNVTSVAEEGLTTLTVITTQVETITSCAPVVTNCPADQSDIDALPESSKATVVVSHTVILTETVCPISDVPKVSASIIEEASTGGITGTTITAAPTSTANSLPVETGAPGGGAPVVENPADTPEEPERTTTVTATTTAFTTVTVQPPKVTQGESSPGSPDSDSGKGNGTPGSPGNADEEVCECAPTVTVTAPASTVYVTVDNSGTKTEAPKPGVTGVADEDDEDAEEGDDDQEEDDTCEGEDEEEDDEEEEDECIPDVTTTTLRATVTVPPFAGNGTTTGGVARPTGFARLRR